MSDSFPELKVGALAVMWERESSMLIYVSWRTIGDPKNVAQAEIVEDERSQRGYALISAMVTIGISALVILNLATALSQSYKVMAELEIKDDLLSVKQAFRERADCNHTLAGYVDASKNCVATTHFPLRDKDGLILGSPEFGCFRLSKWHYRASCTGNRLNIEVGRLQSSASFLPHKLRANTVESWRNAFPSGEMACSGVFQ